MAEIIKDLEITALVHGGRGLGHHEGKAVFVPLTAPGDRINCQVIKSKRRYLEADLLELVEASPQRRNAPCPFFGVCGGCQWQHLPYPEQVRWKEQSFADLLIRNKLLSRSCIKPIAAAPDEWSYRNRVQLKCHFAAGRLAVGFYQHGSHSVVDIDQCLLLAPRIQITLEWLRAELLSLPCPDCVKGIDISCGDDGGVRIVLHALPRGRRQLHLWLHDFALCHQVSACLQADPKQPPVQVHGDPELMIKIDHPELVLRYGPGGFVQVNSTQNRLMIAAMLELLDLRGTESVLDLFCGMGNFSLPVARRAARVVGVEGYLPSILKARLNAAANHIANVEFHAADASSLMTRLQELDDLHLVILDPPRSGNYQVMLDLLKCRPQRILYVSCDPATLARDLVPLVQDGYEVVSSQPIDLFPQTWHIESMTLLRRVGVDKQAS